MVKESMGKEGKHCREPQPLKDEEVKYEKHKKQKVSKKKNGYQDIVVS